MARRPHSRRLTWIAIGFGAFLLADLLLFGWLLLESLSEREVNRALLETREEAEGLAQQLALEARRQGEDLYVVIAKENETKTSIDSVLRQREIIRSIEIRDREGRLVYSREVRVQAPGAAGQTILSPSEVPSHYQIEPIERTETFEMVEVDIPIEDFGQITLGISREQLAARAEALRRDLIARTSVVGGLSLTLLIIAWAVVVWFARRGERLEELAAERERMAYLGTLAAGLAHEIRNPLNSLNLNMQLIEEEMQHLGRGATPRLLTITRDEIGRLERLVTDFLAYARPRAPERGVVDLTELLERVRDQVAAEAREAGATVVVEADEELALVADRAQLQQLLLNVVRNACSAVAAGGKPGTVTLAVAREGQLVQLDVVDTGVGIPAEAMPHIFEVFWSTKKGGTGLGLAIADRIARAHGGEVQVTSTVGEGTRVRLLLPFDTTYSAPVKAS